MFPNSKNSHIFSIFEELKPRKSSSKKPIPSFSSKIHPLFQNKLKKNSNKNLNCSNSLIMFEGQDKSAINKIININHRNKKPKNQNSLSTSSSNFLLFQKSSSNNQNNNTTTTNKHQQNKHHNGVTKQSLQITNQNLLSSTFKSQNPSTNNSIIFTPFNNNNNNSTTNQASNVSSSKTKKHKSSSHSVSHENNKSKNDFSNLDSKTNILLNELIKQLKECTKDGDSNKIIDKKFNIIKNSYFNYVQLLSSEKQRNYLLNIMEMITTIIKFKNDQISELTTTNNSSLEHILHPYNKKKIPLNQMYSKQIEKLKNKKSQEQNKTVLSKTVNLARKEDIVSDESEKNDEQNNGISTTEELEQLQEIQFCDKVKLHKHNSMPNLNIPKLDLNFIIHNVSNTRNKEAKKGECQQHVQKHNQHCYQGMSYSSIVGMKKVFNNHKL